MITFKQTLLRNQTLSTEEVGSFLFEGTNTYNDEVRVNKVVTSCGCTAATYPKRISAGESFIVQVSVDKRDQPGSFNQSATMTFSSGEIIKLKINGTVESQD